MREKHIKAILKEDYPDWTLPYILKLSDEYVVEILFHSMSRLSQGKKSEHGYDSDEPECIYKNFERKLSYGNQIYSQNR